MKKMYISPVLEIVKVNSCSVIAASPAVEMPEGTPDLENGDPTDVADSRRHNNVWDDEEDEEY